MPTVYQLQFTRVITQSIGSVTPFTINVPAGHVWKIESAGIGGTNGTISLKQSGTKLATLFSTFRHNDYGSTLPFWINDSFLNGSITIENENGNDGVISITEYFLGP